MSDAQPIRVLLADDDFVLRAALAALVDSEAAFVCVAAVGNAEDAIDAAVRERPDVALVDVQMPGSGQAAVAGIRSRSPRTTVIALSGHDDPTTALEMRNAGAVGYLVKGTSADAIIEAIENAARGKGSLSPEPETGAIGELT